MPIYITRHDDIPQAEGQLVDTGLGDYNAASAPLHEVAPLSCFARTPAGEVIGGAVGRTWGIGCELQQLWVHPAHRRQGIGAQLVRAFEQQAQARGCTTFYLETFSFQAPSLYRALGYEVKLAIEGFAPGIVKFIMVRKGPAA
jgi:ribosomal protein S18 acetylase RimI-like enzyme